MTDLETTPSTDAVLHAIADSQRRVILRELASEDWTGTETNEFERGSVVPIEQQPTDPDEWSFERVLRQPSEPTYERMAESSGEDPREPSGEESSEPSGKKHRGPTDDTDVEPLDEPSNEAEDDTPVTVAVELLVEAIARTRMASCGDLRSSTEIAIKLRHVHLPTLEDAGLVRYDPEGDRVEYRPNELVESLLAVIDQHWRPTPSQ